jgi:uroporphyrinogen III methyltransferase/synthase
VRDLEAAHCVRPATVCDAMIEAWRQGRRVVRLKGGDPFLFGRGGEEADYLSGHGVPFEVVPGVTSALGAACAGIPLTHRGLGSAVAFVTGHVDPTSGGLDWAKLAHFPGTLVVYMGVARLEEIVRTLLRHGKDPQTPAAVVRWATTASQRTVTAPLAELPAAVARAALTSPALIVIGPVVALRERLAWFESRPLFGRRVLVTRPRGQAADLLRQFEELGADTALLPTVEVREPPDWGPVDRVLADLSGFDWLVFTSGNGVHYLIRRLRQTGGDLRRLGPVKLAAIGPATADALRSYHLEPDLVPARYQSEDLADALAERVRGGRVLLARADRGRELLRERLSLVAQVEQVAVYSQVDVVEPDAAILERLRRGEFDYVTLTSSNIARALLRALGEEGAAPLRDGRTGLVTISPVTSAAVRELGLPVAAEALEATSTGTVRAVVELAAGRRVT